METKDKRRRELFNMKQHKRTLHRKNSGDGSSISQPEIVRGVIDVADSSDDRISARPISWSSKDIGIEYENEQINALDFELLTQMPNSSGHFQFSSEKNWESYDIFLQKFEALEYFTLNINLLNAGLQTIPFYKRMEFPSSWFTKSQLKAMDEIAELAEKQYQSFQRDSENNHKEKIKSTITKKPAEESISRSSTKKNMNVNDQELDNLLSLTTNKVTKKDISEQIINDSKISRPISGKNNSKVIQNGENREGIQQWLDDVLEE